MELAVQPKLLTVLEDGRFRRVGDVRDRSVDVRLLAATHRDLAAAVQEGNCRGDLFFRISTLTIVVPPLRDRVEDITMLADQLVAQIARDMAAGARRCRRRPWPPCRSTPGRGTCGSCGTSWSGRSLLSRHEPLGISKSSLYQRIKRFGIEPFES